MKVGILGAGAYGTALALIAHENNNEITVLAHSEEEKKDLEITRSCSKLKGVVIPRNIKYTCDINEAVMYKDLIVIAVPAGAIDDIANKIYNLVGNTPICIASKGIEQDSCRFLYDIIKKSVQTDHIAIISGPSFAIDVASKNPVGLTLATHSRLADQTIKNVFSNSHFKLRSTDDIIGTEICGAIKNVIALASGMLEGINATESTTAMFITESLHDIKELIKELGGEGKTILSFAGFGDLLLTATCEKSRNFSLGKLIGSGASDVEINNYINNNTIEGLYTLKSIYKLLNDRHIDMPIVELIYNIIYKDESPKKLLEFLIEKS